MSSADGPEGPRDHHPNDVPSPSQTMEFQLFESLVHHLIEKGVLTRNDALSVVQTVAEVKRGELESGQLRIDYVEKALVALRQLYSSFELVAQRPFKSPAADGRNVLHLRPPLHGDNPKFPKDD